MKEKKYGFTLIEVLVVIIILGLLAVILYPTFDKLIKNNKEKLYEKQVETLEHSASLWGTDNLSLLNNAGTYRLDLNTLYTAGYINNDDIINPMTGTDMTGCVVVDWQGNANQYSYKYDPDCNILSIREVASELINNTTTTEYYDGKLLTGSQDANYVWYSGFVWRIMGQDSDGNVKLIMEETLATIQWGKCVSNNGDYICSKYDNSYIKEWLNDYFLEQLKLTNILVNDTWCSEITTDRDSARTTCNNNLSTVSAKVGLITLDEYNLAGKASSYINRGSAYTEGSQNFMTITPYSDALNPDSIIWHVAVGGTTFHYGMGYSYGTRPVIKVKANAVVTKGSGTLDDMYILGENKPDNITGEIKNVVTSGEYVELENKLYRVVSKETDGVKLILDDYYIDPTATNPTNFQFDPNEKNIFTLEKGIGQLLNTTIATWLGIENNANVISTTWDQGAPFDNMNLNVNDYLKSTGDKTTAKVGLIKMGEMLSGYSFSIDITTSSSLWTLTQGQAARLIWSISPSGGASPSGTNTASRIRPVIKVSPSTSITSGNGTMDRPYQI